MGNALVEVGVRAQPQKPVTQLHSPRALSQSPSTPPPPQAEGGGGSPIGPEMEAVLKMSREQFQWEATRQPEPNRDPNDIWGGEPGEDEEMARVMAESMTDMRAMQVRPPFSDLLGANRIGCRIRIWAPCSTSGPSDYRAEESNNLKGKVKVERQLVGLPWAADGCPWVGKLRTMLPFYHK
jgi:hypothetical protein